MSITGFYTETNIVAPGSFRYAERTWSNLSIYVTAIGPDRSAGGDRRTGRRARSGEK